MGLVEENKLIEIRKKSSIPYFILRLTCIGLGFMIGNFNDIRIRTFRPVCLSLCITNIYMFTYLESAINKKNIEQCKAYWAIVLLSCMDAFAIIITIFRINKIRSIIVFFDIYLGLCLIEFVRIYFVCRELGDTFEWYYFKHGGVCTGLKRAYKIRAKYETLKYLLILVVIQGIYLQVEGLRYCGRIFYRAAIIIDHMFDLTIFFAAFFRPNMEVECQRLFLIVAIALKIGWCAFTMTFYGIGCPCKWPLKGKTVEIATGIFFLYYSVRDYKHFGLGLKKLSFPEIRPRKVLMCPKTGQSNSTSSF